MKLLLIVSIAITLASCGSKNPSVSSADAISSNPQPDPVQEDVKGPLVVVLDQTQQQNGNMRIAPVRVAQIAGDITVPGRLTVSEDQTWHVGAIASGRIDAITARVGDSVSAGQILARLHSHDVHEARAAYQEATTELQRSRSIELYASQRRDRAERLFELKAASRQDLETAEADLRNSRAAVERAKSEVEKEGAHLRIFQVPFDDPTPENESSAADDIPVQAPAPGLIFGRKASVGSVVNLGEELFSITDTSNLWMIASANETDLSTLREGQQVRVEVRAYPDRSFSGRILSLGEQLDAETRTLQVRILVPNTRKLLRPEMYATARLQQSAMRAAVFVPEDAVDEINGLPVVFVRLARNEFEARTVKIGQRVAGEAEILEGITGRESVVVKGSFLLKSQLLKSTIQDN